MKCKYEHDDDCCYAFADQYMCKCKQPCEFLDPLTNADRVRGMNDNELATFINRIMICHHLRNEGHCEKCPIHPAKPCDTEGIAEWLKQPVK